MSVRLCCVSAIALCYILCILQHFVQGAVFFPDTVYVSYLPDPTSLTFTFNTLISTLSFSLLY